jgi:hypothetical protein
VERKRLHGEQKTDVEVFLNVSLWLTCFHALTFCARIPLPCVKPRAMCNPCISKI